jgi:mannan endo-1,4-beta-mannosidase
MSWPGKLLAIALPLAVLGAAAWQVETHHVVRHPVSAGTASTGAMARRLPPPRCVALPRPFVGVSVARPVAGRLATFTDATGITPSVLEYYTVFGAGFDYGRADAALRESAVPLVQWNPYSTKLSAIASGAYDGYLRRFAAAIRSLRCPILLSFGHEMNGPWWRWGLAHQSASSFRAAWRHIHDIFTKAGAVNVSWVWNPNVVSNFNHVAFPGRWWPGARYVDMVGLDGYYWNPRDTFASVFGSTLAYVRHLAPGKPVMIAEVGAYPGRQMAARIGNLFFWASARHLAGVVYFENVGHENWLLAGHPAAIAAFRHWVSRFAQRHDRARQHLTRTRSARSARWQPIRRRPATGLPR